jgi:hypothetical protein
MNGIREESRKGDISNFNDQNELGLIRKEKPNLYHVEYVQADNNNPCPPNG